MSRFCSCNGEDGCQTVSWTFRGQHGGDRVGWASSTKVTGPGDLGHFSQPTAKKGAPGTPGGVHPLSLSLSGTEQVCFGAKGKEDLFL